MAKIKTRAPTGNRTHSLVAISTGLSGLSICYSAETKYVITGVQRATDWTLTRTSHEDTEQSTIEASVTLNGVTRTDSLIR
jgi:hypothetical protein